MRNGSSPQSEQNPPLQDYVRLRKESESRIGRLHVKSVNGLLSLTLFVALSIAAQDNFAILPSLPDEVLGLLGRPPSPNMISAALVLYSFSAIILILGRMMSGSERYGGVLHLGYLAAFYVFYHFSHTLAENFWAVFAAGATVLILEGYHVWTYCTEEIRKEREFLTMLERKEKGGFSP